VQPLPLQPLSPSCPICETPNPSVVLSKLGELKSSHLGLPSYSASALIRKQKNAPVDEGKNVIGAEANQDLLIVALNKLVEGADNIILDGHFCLSGATGIFDVPLSTFQAMPLKGIVLLTGDPSLVLSRLVARDGSAMDIEQIRQLQDRETVLARAASDSLGVPLMVAGQDQSELVAAWVSDVLANKSQPGESRQIAP